MIYRFGVFEFDAAAGELRRSGRIVALEPQPARALAALLARADQVVTRDELRDSVWGAGTHVDFDRGLAYCLSQIRAALGDSGENPRFVQTLPRRGYKFIAPVSSAGSSPATASSTPSAPSALTATSPPAVHAPMPVAVSDEPADVSTSVALPPSRPKRGWWLAAALAVTAGVLVMTWASTRPASRSQEVIVAVSVFDNETGMPEHDRLVAGLSDLVVANLTTVAPGRIAVIGNAALLRQPRNIRNLGAVAGALRADYLLLGQLQRGESGLRFITHVIRLSDEAHLKANRLQMSDGGVAGLEAAVVAEFERSVREHALASP
jgi:DNA-binding winged helix-turn-helix (wHTH) protein/TolB-like protein